MIFQSFRMAFSSILSQQDAFVPDHAGYHYRRSGCCCTDFAG